MEKLRCVIVDDDAKSVEMLSGYCQSLPYVDVAARFQDPRLFIKSMFNIGFDVCVVNLSMSKLSGLKVAKALDGKPVIFVASMKDRLADAIRLSPMDIILRPFKMDGLDAALNKARKVLVHDTIPANVKEYGVFNVDGEAGKVRIRIADILLFFTDENNSRHKRIIMRDGSTYTLTNCTFEEILEMSPNLQRVNKTHVVAIDMVRKWEFDLITMDYRENDRYKQVTLARWYRDQFKKKLISC